MHRTAISRRQFIQRAAAGSAGMLAAGGLAANAFGAAGAGEFSIPRDIYPSYVDDKTGATVLNLTPGDHADSITYQTHPMWVDGGRYFMFYSDRSGNGSRPHLLEVATGTVKPVPLNDYSRSTLSWTTPHLYFINKDGIGAVDVVGGFKGEEPARMFGKVPEAFSSLQGTISLDADQKSLYVGGIVGENDRSAIYAVDTETGAAREVTVFDFKVGHIQASPFEPGLIMFCHETGGDAPQRTWMVRADGSDFGPIYKETFDEWVTHEVWWSKDRVVFTIWPYDETHTLLPHGIASATLKDGPRGKMELIAMYPAWHTHGSPDQQWVMGDDFDRNIWVVRMDHLERRLLTQGHNGAGFKTHPHGSFTPDSKAVVFNSSRDGGESILCALLPDDWESLPKAE